MNLGRYLEVRGRNLCLLHQVLVKKFRLHPEGDRTPSEVLLHEIRYKTLHFISYSAAVLIIDYLEVDSISWETNLKVPAIIQMRNVTLKWREK